MDEYEGEADETGLANGDGYSRNELDSNYGMFYHNMSEGAGKPTLVHISTATNFVLYNMCRLKDIPLKFQVGRREKRQFTFRKRDQI